MGKRDYECTPWGNPDLQHLRLAAALLPAAGRLRVELSGADGDDASGSNYGRRAATRSARTAWSTAATSRRRSTTRSARCRAFGRDRHGYADRQALARMRRDDVLEGWVPEIGPYLTLGEVSSSRSIIGATPRSSRRTAPKWSGYVFNRNRRWRALHPVLRRKGRRTLHLAVRGDRDHQVHGQGHRGGQQLEGLGGTQGEGKGRGRAQPVHRAVTPILIFTAVELEPRALARALELPPLVARRPGVRPGDLRVAVVGLRAGLLSARWPALLAGLVQPARDLGRGLRRP